MSETPVWKRSKTARGSICHRWGPYTIEQDAKKRWWVFVDIGGLDVSRGKFPSFATAKETAYADFRGEL